MNYKPPTNEELAQFQQLAQLRAESFNRANPNPKHRKNPNDLYEAILIGHEHGMTPYQAMESINFFNGRPSLSARAMSAAITKNGHLLAIQEASPESVTIVGYRKEWPNVPIAYRYTKEMAVIAGNYDRNSNYKRYPIEMLISRAISGITKLAFADCVSVSYTEEEMEDVAKSETLQQEVQSPIPNPQSNTAAPLAPAPEVEQPVSVLINTLLAEQEQLAQGRGTWLHQQLLTAISTAYNMQVADVSIVDQLPTREDALQWLTYVQNIIATQG